MNGTIGTLKSGNGNVELVKKCVVCGATLLVEKFESQKDRHEICGWTFTEELREQDKIRQDTNEWLNS